MSRGVDSVCLFVCLATILMVPQSASSQSNDWTFCAWEGGVCAFAGPQEVRYGANGSYTYADVVRRYRVYQRRVRRSRVRCGQTLRHPVK